MTSQKNLSCIKAALFITLGLNVVFWSASQDIYSGWEGVPPVPSRNGAVMMTLGDSELSYRFLALILQNLGNTGRDTVPLKSYDYLSGGRRANPCGRKMALACACRLFGKAPYARSFSRVETCL